MAKQVILLVCIICCWACTPKNVVDSPMIETLKGQEFQLHSVRIPCELGCIPVVYGSSSKKKLLEALPAAEISKILGIHYGISVNPQSSLKMQSTIIHFTGLLSESAGRCFYLQDDSIKTKNIIDIEIKAFVTCGPFTGNRVELTYDVLFSSEDKAILRKYGDMASVENRGVLFLGPQDFLDNVENEIKKLPLIIRKDVAPGMN